MGLHPNHVIYGLFCRQEAELQLMSTLLSIILTYTCAVLNTMKNNKTLQWFCGSLYMLAHFFYSHLSLSLKTWITHGKTHHRTNRRCQSWNQHPTHWVWIKDLICGASLIFELYFRVLTSRHTLAATHHAFKHTTHQSHHTCMHWHDTPCMQGWHMCDNDHACPELLWGDIHVHMVRRQGHRSTVPTMHTPFSVWQRPCMPRATAWR